MKLYIDVALPKLQIKLSEFAPCRHMVAFEHPSLLWGANIVVTEAQLWELKEKIEAYFEKPAVSAAGQEND